MRGRGGGVGIHPLSPGDPESAGGQNRTRINMAAGSSKNLRIYRIPRIIFASASVSSIPKKSISDDFAENASDL